MLALVEEFLTARTTRKPSEHTLAAYRRDLTEVARLAAVTLGTPLPRLGVDQLDAGVLRSAFAAFARPRAAASVSRAWSTWNQFFGFLVADGVVPGNPMPAVQRPRTPPRLPKPLAGERTPEELLEAVASGGRRARDPWPERDLAVLALLLCTGLRSAELLSLTVGSLAGRPGERRLHVVGKGGVTRSVPVEAPLEVLLDSYLVTRGRRFGGRPARSAPLFVDAHGAALRRGGLQYLVRQCYRHAGVHDRVAHGTLVHALRHTFATRLAEDGATATEIMRLLGHSSINASQAYIDSTNREQRAAAAANRTYRSVERLAAAAGGAAAGGGRP